MRPRSAHGVSLVPRPLALLGVLEGLDCQSTQQALGSSGIHLRTLVEGVLRKAQTVLPTEGQDRQCPDPHGPSSPHLGRVWPEVYAHPHSDHSPRRYSSHPVSSQWPSEEGRVAWGTCGGRNSQSVCLIDEIVSAREGVGKTPTSTLGPILLSPPTPFTRRWVLGVSSIKSQ